MKVLGIVAEYNPMHNGHIHYINISKEIVEPDYTICVMSGFFTQRGEPAIFDKWERARHAVQNGIDLVIEIPYVYACNSGRFFASAAMDLLNGIGVVTDFSFGAESDLLSLQKTAEAYVNASELNVDVKSFLKKGNSYPKAVELSIAEYDKNLSEVLRHPNNLLGIEYLKRIQEKKYNIIPHVITRLGDYKSLENDEYISSTAARKYILAGDMNLIRDKIPTEISISENQIESILQARVKLFDILRYCVSVASREELKKILTVDEGLENRLIKNIPFARDLEHLIYLISSKRYTYARIRRMLLHVITGLTKADFGEIFINAPGFIRILSFNDSGAELLNIIKKQKASELPVITNLSPKFNFPESVERILKYDKIACDIYNILMGRDLYLNCEYINHPIVVKNKSKGADL